ncbi:hypothetical protein Patl1_00804 [Pistacia atlantica]|uniref:Uncharacterized protein n=1 Tax=Pistacia atlantica TaxID=434234 RepID=A0ACC1C4G0_9ROSI|nr:hypothetical protein Patl1_00804 [Pistacia atlantica]
MGVDCKPIEPGGSCFQPNHLHITCFFRHESLLQVSWQEFLGLSLVSIIIFDNPC